MRVYKVMKIGTKVFTQKKQNREKITMLTCYDAPMAALMEQCSVDILLVGDSVGTTMLGYNSVREVTIDDIRHHVRAVRRGAPKSFILADIPFQSMESKEQLLHDAQLLMDNGASAVKIESEHDALDKIAYVVSHEIPVCGHIGYTPQTEGLTVTAQGKTEKRAQELYDLAQACENIGTFMIVFELIPTKLAELLTQSINIPTIGIGAGAQCDGEVQVITDILGLPEKSFRHTKKYLNGRETIINAIQTYVQEVRHSEFPTEQNSSKIKKDVLQSVKGYIQQKGNS